MSDYDYKLRDGEAGFTVIKKSRAATNPERHFHTSYELLFLFGGERKFFCDGRTFSIGTGDFLCLEPGKLHRGINLPGKECSLYNLYFDDSSSPMFLSILPLLKEIGQRDPPVISLRENDRRRIEQYFTEIAGELEHRRCGYLAMAWGRLFQCLAELVRYQSTIKEDDSESHMNPIVEKVLTWLTGHFRESISLGRISREFYISEAYFSRLFRQTTHFGFVEYLNSLRVQEACRMLSNTSLSAGEIAWRCGFGSVTQFGRTFRRITGDSPSGFRKKHTRME